MRTISIALLAAIIGGAAAVLGAAAAEPAAKKPNPLAKGNPMTDALTGTFKSADLTVTILPAGPGKYRGTLMLEAKSYPFTAEKDGPGISGTFTSEGEKYDFLAKLEGDALQLKSGDTVYVLMRQGPPKPANPLDRGGTGAPAKPAAPKPEDGVAAGAGNVDPAWRVIRHPIGLSVRYPKDWSVKDLPDSHYQLIPPGAAAESEVYLLGSIPANGVPVATDPRVTAAAEAIMTQLAPAMQRVGQPETLKAGEVPVVALTWEGGQNARARMYLIILKDQAIGLTAIALKENLAAREPVLRKIFTSFQQSQAQHDPQLVGAWNKLGTSELAARDAVGRLQASSVGEHRRTLLLRADGTCLSREVDRTIAIGQGVAIDTGDQVKEKRGSWYGGDGTIVLMWENDAEEYDYRLGGQPGARQLVFVLDKGRGLVWGEAR